MEDMEILDDICGHLIDFSQHNYDDFFDLFFKEFKKTICFLKTTTLIIKKKIYNFYKCNVFIMLKFAKHYRQKFRTSDKTDIINTTDDTFIIDFFEQLFIKIYDAYNLMKSCSVEEQEIFMNKFYSGGINKASEYCMCNYYMKSQSKSNNELFQHLLFYESYDSAIEFVENLKKIDEIDFK